MNKKSLAKYMTSLVVIILALLLVYININGINPIKETANIVDKVSDEISGEADKKRKEEENIFCAIEQKKCNCKYWKEHYPDWEEQGYVTKPTMEYDPLNKIGRYGIYGIPKVKRIFFDDISEYMSKYSENLEAKAPQEAFLDDKSLNQSVVNLDNLTEIGEKMCYAPYLTDVTVNDIKILDNVTGYNKAEGIVFNDFYRVVDEQTGMLNNVYPALNPELYPQSGEIVYVIVNLTIECNSPWVIELPIDYAIRCYKKADRCLVIDESAPQGELYSPCLGYDGMAVYVDKIPKEFEGYFYPIGEGEKVTMNMGYFVDKAYIDNMYLVFNLGNNEGYASAYQYAIKITE